MGERKAMKLQDRIKSAIRNPATSNGQGLVGEGIHNLEIAEAAEVVITGDEFGDAVFETQRDDVSVVNHIAGGCCMAHGCIEHGRVVRRFRQQHERRRRQNLAQIFEGDIERDGRMEDARMSRHSEKFVNAGPGNRPGGRPLGEAFQNLEGAVVMPARLNFGINQNVRVNRLQRSAPVHQVEQRVAIRQAHARQLGRLPTPKAHPIGLPRLRRQRAAKEVAGDGLQRAALFGGFFLQLPQEMVFKRQGGSPHA